MKILIFNLKDSRIMWAGFFALNLVIFCYINAITGKFAAF